MAVLDAAGITDRVIGATCFYIHKAHDVLERPLRADTPQGPRVALTRSDTLNVGTKMSFVLKNLWPKVFTEDVLRLIFSRGELMGYGQWRSGGYGRFTFEMSEIVFRTRQ